MANYAPPEKIEEAKRLRRLGYSLRSISKALGMHRETIMEHVGKISRSDAMRMYHERRKGRTEFSLEACVVRERKQRFVPIGEDSEGYEQETEIVSLLDEGSVPEDVVEPIAKSVAKTVGQYRFDRRTRLTVEEEFELWKAWKVNGDVSARDLIIRCHMHYVEQIVHMLPSYGVPFDVLIAEGNYGLIKALDKFEPERGLRFITYAAWWIKSTISNYIRVSRTVINRELVRSGVVYKLRREYARAMNLVGNDHDAVVSMVSERVKLPVGKVRDLLQRLNSYDVSLDKKFGDDSNQALVDTLAADTATPDAGQDAREQDSSQRALVAPALGQLEPRERFIAEKRFMEDEPPSLAELGRQLGVSRERVRQIETKVIRKLRKTLGKAQVIGV